MSTVKFMLRHLFRHVEFENDDVPCVCEPCIDKQSCGTGLGDVVFEHIVAASVLMNMKHENLVLSLDSYMSQLNMLPWQWFPACRL